ARRPEPMPSHSSTTAPVSGAVGEGVVAEGPRVLLVYRDAGSRHCVASSVGLGVSALHTARVLARAGIATDVVATADPDDVRAALTARPTVTHCVIEAPWIESDVMADLTRAFPGVDFTVRCHSQLGFLQAEPEAIQILRELIAAEDDTPNLSVSTNSRELARFLADVYAARVVFLPNLYDVEWKPEGRLLDTSPGVLRIGSFGALRQLKNHTTAAAAALMLAKQRGVDLEFWVTVDGAGDRPSDVLKSLRLLFDGVDHAKLVEQPWQDWPDFRRTVASMDLCLQVSMTETFNITTADAVAEGVPSVVSPALEWAPDAWKAETDRLEDIVRIGGALLDGVDAAGAAGRLVLESFVGQATLQWVEYVSTPSTLRSP
ncbi:MAG: hypothetical protein ACHREM_17920, partial [Polyangiales bacterium]